MLRTCAAAAAVVAAMSTGGFTANAYPAPRSTGLSEEFPVGSCLDVTDDFTIDYMNIFNVGAVPCTDPSRNYRVVKHAPNAMVCGPDTDQIFNTADVVVLCTVQDPEPGPVVPFGG